MRRLYFLVTVMLLIILSVPLVIGCKEQTTSVTEPSTPEPAIPAHFTTFTDESGLYSISYPPDWVLALSEIEGLEQAMKELITSIESDAAVEKTTVIFLAGLAIEMGYSPNVNILVESLPEAASTHDKMIEMEVNGIKYFLDDYHEFSRVKTTVGGREATILEWEGTYPQLGRQHQLQMFILVNKVGWVVTCTPPSGEFDEWEDDFQAVVRSLRIHK
jgi:hypothetical protein